MVRVGVRRSLRLAASSPVAPAGPAASAGAVEVNSASHGEPAKGDRVALRDVENTPQVSEVKMSQKAQRSLVWQFELLTDPVQRCCVQVQPPAKRSKKIAPTLSKAFEERLWQKGHAHVAGVDEAGRGPLAGPVSH